MPIPQHHHQSTTRSRSSQAARLAISSCYCQLAAMARPTAAAAGLLACAVLLLCSPAKSAAILFDFPSFPFIAIFPGIFPLGYVQPPPVRIYSRQNTGLNMAVRDGKVVLVTATSGDAKQVYM